MGCRRRKKIFCLLPKGTQNRMEGRRIHHPKTAAKIGFRPRRKRENAAPFLPGHRHYRRVPTKTNHSTLTLAYTSHTAPLYVRDLFFRLTLHKKLRHFFHPSSDRGGKVGWEGGKRRDASLALFTRIFAPTPAPKMPFLLLSVLCKDESLASGDLGQHFRGRTTCYMHTSVLCRPRPVVY